jgi:uncharacterized protein (UPF0335 family)
MPKPKPKAKDDLLDTTHLGNEKTGALRAFIERIESIEAERAALADDIKEVLVEAKAAKLDAKAIKKIVSIRKKDRDDWQAEQAVLDAYLLALGLM